MRSARSHGTWLREYLLQHLQALGVDRIETATALIVVRKSPPAVQIVDEALIPDAFIRIVKSVDRSLLRTALLNEKEIPGARLMRTATAGKALVDDDCAKKAVAELTRD